MGSTEGNLYGLWNAREYLSGHRLLEDKRTGARALRYAPPSVRPEESPEEYKPVALFSTDIHYSIGKALRALQIPTIGEWAAVEGSKEDADKYLTGVPSYPEEDEHGRAGEIDLTALQDAAEKVLRARHPLVVIFNYGSAFRGAYDDVGQGVRLINDLVRDINGGLERDVQGGKEADAWSDTRTWVWYHVDGALGAAFAPLTSISACSRFARVATSGWARPGHAACS
jgi:histidine decarboxylase